jgi:hypothetical protein
LQAHGASSRLAQATLSRLLCDRSLGRLA